MSLQNVRSFVSKHRELLWLAGVILGATAIHFHDPEIFSRQLITIDDDNFVEPVGRVTDLTTYFTKLLPDRSTYMFPLRDLTTALDFKLGEVTGIQTFWLGNFIYWALALFFAWRMFSLLFPDRFWLRAALIAMLALHPLNVELIQWAAMRKHLLAMLFVSWGSVLVLKRYLDEQAVLGWKDLASVLALTVASLLSWPSGLLWPLGVVWLLRRKLLKQRAPILLLIVGAVALAALAYHLSASGNVEYTQYQSNLLTSEGLERAFRWAWLSAGRATFDFLIPIRLSTFFDMLSILSRIGIVLLVGSLAVFAWVSRRAARTGEGREFVRRGWDLLVYALFILAPQTYVALSAENFIWMDHYLYGELPYLFMAIACFALAGLPTAVRRASPASITTACALVLGAYSALSLAQVPRWHDAVTVFNTCLEVEDAPLCAVLGIEKGFDVGGCPSVFPFFERARLLYADWRQRDALKYEKTFAIELPLVESLCTATAVNMDLATKLRLIGEQEHFYQKPTSVLFAKVLSHLGAHDLEGAWQVARTTYLDPNYTIALPSEKILILFGGQAEGLCALSAAEHRHPECPELLQAYRDRTDLYIKDIERRAPGQREWSRNMALRHYGGGSR